HAYLHRKEGDHGNARYWYSNADNPSVVNRSKRNGSASSLTCSVNPDWHKAFIVLANPPTEADNNLSPPLEHPNESQAGAGDAHVSHAGSAAYLQLLRALLSQQVMGRPNEMRAIIFGAEKYAVCPLCTQEVPSDVFRDDGYRKRCRSEVARLQQMLAMKVSKR